jgi:Amidase
MISSALPVANHFPPPGDAATAFIHDTCAGNMKTGLRWNCGVEASLRVTVPSRPYKSFSYDPAMILNVDGRERGLSSLGFDLDFVLGLFGSGVYGRVPESLAFSFPFFPAVIGSFVTMNFGLCPNLLEELLTLGTTGSVADFSTRAFFGGGSLSLFLPYFPMSIHVVVKSQEKNEQLQMCLRELVSHRIGKQSHTVQRRDSSSAMRSWPNAQRIHVIYRRLATEAARCRRVIAERNPDVNAVVFTSEYKLSPSTVDASRPLLGMPVAIKDNICTNSIPTTCSSEMLKGSFHLSHHLFVTNLVT